MKPVMQTITTSGDGDCMRAVVASLFELTIEQVPHFLRFGDRWHDVLLGFAHTCGYEVGDNRHVRADETELNEWYFDRWSVDGIVWASVDSRNIKGGTHAVLIDKQGVVVHDPRPDGNSFLGANVFETREVHYWWTIRRRVPDVE